MKFLHTSDWHVGRTLNGWSLLEEQAWAFQQIVDLAISEKVDGVIIAGDLYDRAVPPVDAIKLFNKTLARLVLEEQIPVYAISGNHDGAERLHFGRDFFQPQGLHLSTRLEEAFEPIELEDCQIFLLPFIDPIDARIYYKDDEDKEIQGICDALGGRLARIVSFSACISIRSFSWICTLCLESMMQILLVKQEIKVIPTNVSG